MRARLISADECGPQLKGPQASRTAWTEASKIARLSDVVQQEMLTANQPVRQEGVLRDWQGLKDHLGSVTDEELLYMAAYSRRTLQLIEQFVDNLEIEFERRKARSD